MLKSALLSGFKSTTNGLPYNSLYSVSKYFRSKAKTSQKDKDKKYGSDPRYKKIAKLRIPDLNDPNITFPINIPIRFRWVYRPSKIVSKIPRHDFIDFTKMKGNEILLNLENAEHLRHSELVSALFELSKNKSSKDIDWNEHEWVKNAVNVCIKHLSQYDKRAVSTLALAAHRLRLTEPLLWSTLEKEGFKIIQTVKARSFACLFMAFLSQPDRCSKEYKDKLAYHLPMHIRKMSSDIIVNCFELAHQNGLITDYLFEHHFFMLFWKRHAWFGAKNYAKIIRVLAERNFKSDIEFWNQDFLSQIDKFLDNTNEADTKALIEAVKFAKEKIPEIESDAVIEKLENRLVFINTKLKALENAKFWNIVSNDLQYYREKEKMRILKEKGLAV